MACRLSPGSAPPEKGAWWDCSMDPSPGQKGCDAAGRCRADIGEMQGRCRGDRYRGEQKRCGAAEGPRPRLHPHLSSVQPCVCRCDAPEESLGEDEQEVEGESLGSDDDLDESDEGDEGDEAGVTVAAEAAAPAVAPAVTACAEVDLVPDHVHDPEQADDDDDDDELLAMLD